MVLQSASKFKRYFLVSALLMLLSSKYEQLLSHFNFEKSKHPIEGKKMCYHIESVK